MLPSLRVRLIVGIGILAILAIFDLSRHGRAATRWRDYLYLIACVAMAMIYGIVNDQITSRISWEYFYYGKALAPIIGPDVPPNMRELHWQAVRIGIEATWSAGLIIGAVVLYVDSLRKQKRTYKQMLGRVAWIALFSATLGVSLGVVGAWGGLNWMGEDFHEMSQLNLWQPRHFMIVYGIHLGGYVGGGIGLLWAIRKPSRKFSSTPDSSI